MTSTTEKACRRRGVSKPLDQFRGHKNFNVDHDHATGRERGLLCAACNRGIAVFKDDSAALMRAALHVGVAGNF